jgi:hypothetical protein
MEAAVATGCIDKDADGSPIATGRDGCKGWLMWLYLHEPKTAAALLARTLPYFITVAEQSPVATRAEIEEEFRELGLPMGLIDYLQKAPAELPPGENPDPPGGCKAARRTAAACLLVVACQSQRFMHRACRQRRATARTC